MLADAMMLPPDDLMPTLSRLIRAAADDSLMPARFAVTF